MGELWGSLVPLIIGSALVPIQIVITTMLLRSKAGKVAAVASLAGMTVVRLGQGLVFGLILGGGTSEASTSGGPGAAVSLLLLVVAILFYVTAVKQLLNHPDEDAPPPKWMAMVESVTPGKAFGLGAGVLLHRGQVLGVHPGRDRRHRRGGYRPGRRGADASSRSSYWRSRSTSS